MTVTVKGNAPLVVPQSALRKAGIRSGDKLKFETKGSGVITIEKEFEDARGEYTPAQRKIIDARLDEAMKEYERGEVVGPFDTAEEMIASMKTELKRRRALKKPRK
jgi:bifunctional DNA-binding transcriptional regulator/antitoxin component of YhaV-PrlF toxin-antitoxin module